MVIWISFDWLKILLSLLQQLFLTAEWLVPSSCWEYSSPRAYRLDRQEMLPNSFCSFELGWLLCTDHGNGATKLHYPVTLIGNSWAMLHMPSSVLSKLHLNDSQILTRKIHQTTNTDSEATSPWESDQDWNCLDLTSITQPLASVDLYTIGQRIHFQFLLYVGIHTAYKF